MHIASYLCVSLPTVVKSFPQLTVSYSTLHCLATVVKCFRRASLLCLLKAYLLFLAQSYVTIGKVTLVYNASCKLLLVLS